jgi:hypothetical protein
MLKAYKKHPWMFCQEVNRIEEILQLLSDTVNNWNEYGIDKIQKQFHISNYQLALWKGLAYHIDNISVSQTYDLQHATITYYDEFVEQVEEYLRTGRVYLTKHYEA